MLGDLAPFLALQYLHSLIALRSWRSGILTGPLRILVTVYKLPIRGAVINIIYERGWLALNTRDNYSDYLETHSQTA